MDGLRLCTIKWSHSVSGNKDLMPSFTCGSQPGASWMRNGPHRVVRLNVSWGQKCLGEALGAKVLREEVLTLGMGFDVSKVHGSLSASGLWIKQHPLLSTPGCICIYHSYCSRAVPACRPAAIMTMVVCSPSETGSKPLESNASLISCLGHEISPQ